MGNVGKIHGPSWPVHMANPNNEDVNVAITAGDAGGLAIAYADGPSLDAFARLRISNPFTLFDSKQIWDDPDIANNAENYPLFYDNQETSGAGTSTTFNVNRASTALGVSNVTAGTRVRQTKQRFNYQPGKSMLVILTGIMSQQGNGITKRLGYFDENNGLFFQVNDNTLSVVRRSNATGSPVDTVVPQAGWNLDTMDGNGPSGVNLNLSNTQIFFMDFEWLGVGRVRFGFFVDGLPVYCHELLNANNLDVVYMSNPNLPIRVEVSNDGTGGAATLEHICTTVVSEGGLQPNGILRFGDIGGLAANDITAATPGNAYAVCGIRLKAAYLSADVREATISLIENSGANNPFLWKLHLNPTLTTGLTYSDIANSAIQFGVGLPAGDVLTNEGTVMAGGYQSRTDATVAIDLNSALRLGSLTDGTPDELVLSASPITNNQLFFGGMQWREAW